MFKKNDKEPKLKNANYLKITKFKKFLLKGIL